ncbi:carotenoid oxygenase family protein, partial [Saccharothrix sp. MB29]|nr:carotenoid oxygenase family protein [Saccharothrix sp. MB29]
RCSADRGPPRPRGADHRSCPRRRPVAPRIGLLPRNAGHAEPRWFPVAPGFTSQAVNAFEEDGKVVVDAVRHDGAFDGGPAPRPHLGRWTLDLATGAVAERRLVEAVDTAG